MHKVAESVRFILENYGKPVPADKRGSVIAICLARALSVDLALPTSEVTSIQVFYNTNCYQRVADVVAEFNEHYVIDTKMVMEYVFKYYKLRYALVFDPQAIVQVLSGKDLSDDLIPGNLIELVRCNSDVQLNDAFRMLLREFTAKFREGELPTTVKQSSQVETNG